MLSPPIVMHLNVATYFHAVGKTVAAHAGAEEALIAAPVVQTSDRDLKLNCSWKMFDYD